MPAFATLDPNNLLLQQADGKFIDVGLAAGIASVKRGRGGMLVDLNGDGMLDMVVVNRWDKAQLWRNVGTGTNAQPLTLGSWLQIRLQQSGTNHDAIGAWVEVDLGDRLVRQELTVGGGHASGHLGWMHFGLGASAGVSKPVQLRVQWPHGNWSNWLTVEANNFYVVDKEQGISQAKMP